MLSIYVQENAVGVLLLTALLCSVFVKLLVNLQHFPVCLCALCSVPSDPALVQRSGSSVLG